MKKLLLGTSALIGAALISGAALAEDPKVTVGGFNTFEAGYTTSDFDQNQRNRVFRNNTEIHFNVAGKSDAGLGYGAEIDLIADIGGGTSPYVPTSSSVTTPVGQPGYTNNGLVAHRTYAWLQGDHWGHLEMGSNDGVTATMKVDAASVARATGGINGDWSYFADVNNTTGTGVSLTGQGAAGTFGGSGLFITAPRLPVEHGPANGFFTDLWGNNNKITYYTPRFSGLQLGVSYAPDLENRGQVTSRTDYFSTGIHAKDIWEGAINYQGQFDQIGVAAAVTGQAGDVVDGVTATEDLKAWNAGAKVSYLGFSLAGSYGDWSDSFTINDTDADYWTVGGAYENGPFGASVTYLSSNVDPAGSAEFEFQDVSVGVDYKLAPGLTPFVEYTWYELDDNASSALENEGHVVLVGSQLSF